jgi:protein ImuA
MPATKQDIISQLRKDILLLQGFKPPAPGAMDFGLGAIAGAFPNAVFPTGVIHEFLSTGVESAAASGGFVAGLTGSLMGSSGACIWITAGRKIFPPGLKTFGIEPDRVIFVDVRKEKEVLWVMEESLKHEGLAAVIGEMQEISFTASRRLQLAVEQSRVTGFLLRHNPRNVNAIASVARWHITPLASSPEASLPGVGFPRWNVELVRVRNGQPGTWQMEWSAGRFHTIVPAARLQGILPAGRLPGIAAAERTHSASSSERLHPVTATERLYPLVPGTVPETAPGERRKTG